MKKLIALVILLPMCAGPAFADTYRVTTDWYDSQIFLSWELLWEYLRLGAYW